MITVHFVMADRSEYDIDVTGIDPSERMLKAQVGLINAVRARGPFVEASFAITSFQIVDTEPSGPAVDKHDGITAVRSPLQKVRLDLLPTDVLVDVAKVFTFGAAQYGDKNWEEGFSYSRCYGAALRHMMKWQLGQECDEESGITHLAHAITNLCFLVHYQRTGVGRDDRGKFDDATVQAMFKPFNTNAK